MTPYHRLTICDLSCDFRDQQTFLFRTEEGARGYAARKGTFHGYTQYKLNGIQIGIDAADIPLAEEPVGYELGGKPCLYVGVAA